MKGFLAVGLVVTTTAPTLFFFEEHFELFNTFSLAQPQCLCGLQRAEVTIDGSNGDHLWVSRSLDMGLE